MAMAEGSRREMIPKLIGFAGEDEQVGKLVLLMIPRLLGSLPTKVHHIPKDISFFFLLLKLSDSENLRISIRNVCSQVLK